MTRKAASAKVLPMTVMCVGEHAVVLDGLTLIINRQRDMTVVATAPGAKEALRLHARHKPDITLVDLRLPGYSGIEVVAAIRRKSSEAHIVALTMWEHDQNVCEALAACADGYLLKDMDADDLIRILRNVHAGRRASARSVRAIPSRGKGPLLTRREHDVLKLIAIGLRDKEIATELSLSAETIHTHLKHVYEKLKVSGRTRALAEAIRRGLVQVR